MKKIFTLGFGVLISLASFAQHGNDHFYAFGGGRANVKVTIDDNHFEHHPGFAETRANVQPAQPYNDRGWNNDSRRDNRVYAYDHNYNNNFHGGYVDRDRRPEEVIRTISNEDFFATARVMDRENDNGRLLYAERLVDDNYLCAEQVKELARFFSFDGYRLDFVRYAYNRTTDKENFGVVCNAFCSNDGRNQVMNFIQGCR
jgi:hypothetical protein